MVRNRKDGGDVMTYELWDKKKKVDGKEPVEIIGEEQLNSDEQFLLFYEGESIVAIESISTIKVIYNLKGETPEEIAEAYIVYQNASNIKEPGIEDYIIDLDFRLAKLELGV